jgi:hypothetical protein
LHLPNGFTLNGMTSKTDNNDPSCSEIRERIPLFIGGDLDLGVLECVSEHLQRCPSCAEVCEQAQRGREALIATLRQREPDYKKPNLWGGVRAALMQEELLPLAGEVLSDDGALENPAAKPSRSLSLVPSLTERAGTIAEQPDRVASVLAGSGSGSDMLRRASGWVGLAAAACALFFLWPDGGGENPNPLVPSGGPVAENSLDSSPGVSSDAPDTLIESLPAPTNFLAGYSGNAANAIPVSHSPLRKIQPGQKLLSDGAQVYRTPVRSDAPVGKVPGQTSVAGHLGKYQ